MIHRLHRRFNISIAEIDKLDNWKESVIVCAHISNNTQYSQAYIQKIPVYIMDFYKNVELIETKYEILMAGGI